MKSLMPPLGVSTTTTSSQSLGHLPATTSYCGSISALLPINWLKTLVLMLAAISGLSETAEPKPSDANVVSGLTWRTPALVSELKICGVTAYE